MSCRRPRRGIVVRIRIKEEVVSDTFPKLRVIAGRVILSMAMLVSAGILAASICGLARLAH